MAIHARRALVGLVTTAAVLALPAVAAAAPVLAVTQSTTTAGTNPATVTFNSTFTSAPNDVTFALPAGLLANANQGGGACLASSTPNSACIVGTGSVTSGVGPAAPVTLYLVAAPAAGDAAGVALVQGTTTLSTAAVTVRSTDGGLNVAFSSLSADAISAMSVSLTTLRMPSSCPTTPANVTLTADGASSTAPLNVTGCSGQTYQPALSASITKDAHDSGGELVLGITQGATEAASKSITLGLGSAVTPNVGADLACLAGTACTIGTATATSPLLPSVALASGTVTLGGSTSAPTIAVSFPAPFAMTLTGAVNLSSNSVTFGNVPDLPLTNLTLTVTGPGGQKAFTITSCAPNDGDRFVYRPGQPDRRVERGDQVQQLRERSEGFGFEQAVWRPGIRASRSRSARAAAGRTSRRSRLRSPAGCRSRSRRSAPIRRARRRRARRSARRPR